MAAVSRPEVGERVRGGRQLPVAPPLNVGFSETCRTIFFVRKIFVKNAKIEAEKPHFENI